MTTQTQDQTQNDNQTDDSQQTQTQDSTLLDDATQTADQTHTQTQDTVLTQPISIVKPDGTFIEGWRDKLPEELRGEECLGLVNDFPEMVKQFVNQRKAIGKNKVAIPTDKSDENEWNVFYEAIGRPKTETGYNVPDIPEELSEIFTEERLTRAKQRAYKLGATQKQFSEYLQGEMEEVVQTLKDQAEDEAKQLRETRLNAEKELRAELGAAFDERLHIANRLMTEAIPKEADRVAFKERYGNDVMIIRLLSNIGARMSEHTNLIAELTDKTPTEIDGQIKTLENDPRYTNINSDMTKEEREQHAERIRELYKKRYPAKTG